VESAFSSIDPVPLATASLAQAHKAILKDGSSVVLKVLKPGILDQLHADLGILLELAGLLERHFADLGFSPVDVSKEFAEEVEREIDYISEANATEKLRRYFLDDREISFPKVYRELSTAKVLTLEFVDGLPLADGGAAAISKEARNIAVKAIVRAVFRQCLEFGFFHADPHPGNIFVLKNGTVCFIDCGMIGQVDSITAGQVAKLCHVVVKGDVDACVDALLGLTDSDPRIGRNRSLRTDVSKLVAQFHGGTLETLHVGVILVDFFELLRKHDIRCPSDLVFLIKALSTVESVAEELDPGFDVIGYSQPFLEKVIKRQYGVKAILGRAENALVDYAELAERLPQNINNLLDRFISERFAIHLEHKGLTALTHSIRHMGSYLSQSLIASSVLVGSAILVLADKVGGESGTPTFVGTIGFSFSFFYILILIVGSWRK
jgi:ubiquinone biosynthesis protein